MATPSNTTVKEPYIVIELQNGTDITTIPNSNTAIGVVRQVYDLGVITNVGDTVVFNNKNVNGFTQSSATYFIVNESDILMTWTEAP